MCLRSDVNDVLAAVSYAPELNPTELLNQDVKTNALGRRRPHTQTELIGETLSYLRSRQHTPHIVARYFEEKQVSYAKATRRPFTRPK
jgi:hypothetical protein